MYLSYYQKFPASYEGLEIEEVSGYSYLKDSDPADDEGILLIKDELQLSDLIFKDLMITENLTGAWYEIQSAIQRTKNNLKFGNTKFDHKSKRYSILTSEMFQVCSNEYATGVLFIITPATATISLGNLSQIYDGTPKSVTVSTNPSGLDSITLLYYVPRSQVQELMKLFSDILGRRQDFSGNTDQ